MFGERRVALDVACSVFLTSTELEDEDCEPARDVARVTAEGRTR
jgi:hypothetical protein